MIIYAVVIIKSNGTPIFTDYFQSTEEIPDSELFGRMIISIKGFINEFLNEDMKTIEMEKLSFSIKSFGFFSVVFVTDVGNNPFNLINEVGYRFIKEFSTDLIDKNPRITIFKPFKKTLREILGTNLFDYDGWIKPSKIFNTIDIYDLPHDLRKVALAIISLTEASLSDLSKEAKIEKKELESKLFRLQQLGYVGKKAGSSETLYFCRTT